MASATAEAMKNASSNANGAMMGFMGMNMASNAGQNVMGAVGASNESLYNPNPAQPEPGTIFGNNAEPTEAPAIKECPNCHTTGTGKFCSECGTELK